jgi:hypothetical protein
VPYKWRIKIVELSNGAITLGHFPDAENNNG